VNDPIDQFKIFDEQLNKDIRDDAQNEIVKCQNYDIPDIDKRQCALCGEYVIYVMDWKDAKKAEFKRLTDLTQISPELGDGHFRILSFAADIAYGKTLDNPKDQLEQIEKEAMEKAINLKNACAPLFTKAKVDLIKLGIKVFSGGLKP
jgi:hypothetical protein